MNSSVGDLNRAHYEQLYQDPLEGRSFEVRSKTMIFETFLKQIRRWLPPAPAVLDVGFGSGGLLSAAEKALPGSRLNGIEPIQAAVDAGRRRHSSWNLLVASADALPFEKAAFDVVACSHVLEHLPDDAKPISEIWRVVKPGGLVVIGVPGTGSGENELHARLYAQRDVESMFRPATPVRCQSFGSHPFLAFYWFLARLAGNKPGQEVQAKQAERRPRQSLLRETYLRIGVPVMLTMYRVDSFLPTPKRHPLEVWAAWKKPSS